MGPEDGLTRCHVAVRGRVHGVGFRWFVRERARELGLRGSVQNRRDGTVEVRAEGERAAIGKLLQQLHAGPEGAEVKGVDMLVPLDDDAILPNPFTIER